MSKKYDYNVLPVINNQNFKAFIDLNPDCAK